jgi:ubiquinone/menaquinone biosynthesis C-methylase UbiE
MIERILEPEVMETWEDAVEYDAMDFTEVNTAFADCAVQMAPPSGLVLDLGTGTARIPILVLQRNPKLFIEAVDFSINMLKLGRQNIYKTGMEGCIVLKRADAKKLNNPGHSFDFVMSNSLVHHLPNPRPFFHEVKRVAKPNAGILIRDLLRPKSSAEFSRLVELYTDSDTDHQKKLFSDSLHAALTLEEVHAILRDAGLGNLKLYQSSDRHWTAERKWKPR